jgi:hypothetical protein
MTRVRLLNELDQLIAEALNPRCFGEGSHTVIKLRVAYQTALKDHEMFTANDSPTDKEPSDDDEFTAAHAGERCREAAAINKEHGR